MLQLLLVSICVYVYDREKELGHRNCWRDWFYQQNTRSMHSLSWRCSCSQNVVYHVTTLWSIIKNLVSDVVHKLTCWRESEESRTSCSPSEPTHGCEFNIWLELCCDHTTRFIICGSSECCVAAQEEGLGKERPENQSVRSGKQEAVREGFSCQRQVGLNRTARAASPAPVLRATARLHSYLFGHGVDQSHVQILLSSDSWTQNGFSFTVDMWSSTFGFHQSCALTITVEQLQFVMNPIVGFLSCRLLNTEWTRWEPAGPFVSELSVRLVDW